PSEQRWLLFAVAGVLGGALGNLIDRIAFGQVTDFLLLYWRQYQWPAFNVADSFISIGVTILVAHSLFSRRRQSQPWRPLGGVAPRRWGAGAGATAGVGSFFIRRSAHPPPQRSGAAPSNDVAPLIIGRGS